MNFFVIDSPLMRFLGRVGDILILNLLFVATSLPLVTVGTALSALYTVTMKLVRKEEPSVIKAYFRAYKQNFKPATACWIFMAAVAALLYLDFHLLGVLDGTAYTAGRFILAVILGIWALIFAWLFPYVARFENTFLGSVKNALFLSVAHIPSTLVMLGISAGALVITLYTPRSFVIGLVVWLFAGFATLAYAYSHLLCKIFAKYEGKIGGEAGEKTVTEKPDRNA